MPSDYFPPSILDPRPKAEELLHGWFAKHLHSMGEPALFPSPDNQPLTFRFLGLPTWDKPYMVRVEQQSAGWRLVGRMTDGDGGYEPGLVIRTIDGQLSGREAHRLGKLIAKLAFWELPTTTDESGWDGVTWVLESAHAGRYHVAHRWCPTKNEFARFCSFLGQLGGFHAE